MTDPILDSARKLLKFGPAMPLPHADTVRALCRALIARTEALRELIAMENEWTTGGEAFDETGQTWITARLDVAMKAARAALGETKDAA